MTKLGCLTPLGLISATLGLIASLVVGILFGGSMFSPGALNAATFDEPARGGVATHAEIGGNCAACHAEPWSAATMATRCLVCHTDVQNELNDPKSLHGALHATQCRDCHTEHNGAQASLVRSSVDFPHELTGFALAKHQKKSNGSALVCADCHGNNISKIDQATCVSCHQTDQPNFATHVTAFGNNCTACHDGVDRFTKFDHQAIAFQLVGKHTSVQCAQCHANARTVAALSSAPQNCIDCHRKDDKHKNAYGTNCTQCHTPADWKQAKFDHNLSAFKLTGKHTTVDCAKCHVNNVFKGTPQNCIDCHRKDDKHKNAYGTNCAQCHTPDDWKQAKFDHNLSAFKLTGKHTTVDCAKCHVNNVFKGTPQNCIDCHRKDDKHKNAYGTNCAQCHTPADWKQAKFDHNLSVFKLTGKHTTVDCAKCHVNSVYKGTPQNCIDCHRKDDKHNGGFGTTCAQCHATTGWKDVNFKHAFPLNHGARTNSACTVCHTTPNNYKAYTCYGCHEHDPNRIASKHRSEGITKFDDCARCHPTGRSEEKGGD